jgi:hypothetical protein
LQKIVQLIIVILVGITVMFGGRWYMYVAQADSPYDEVGIALNGYMPSPLRTWGCHKLQSRFEGQLPPQGCAAPDGRSWR